MEVASLIINDQYAAGRISAAAYEIFGREFRTYQTPGTSATSFQTTEIAQARVPGLLVNDGFGVNQVIYMLAKILRRGIQTTLIEEPEVHLHPVVIRKLAQFMTRIAREDRKQLIMTTHSAQLLLSLLACVRAGQIPAEEIACYYVDREGRRSIFKREPVTSDGQVSDGLSSFMEPELEDIQSLFSKRK
jgi:predicted ATPase